MLLKCYSQYVSKFGKFSTTTGLEKVSFHSTPKERQFQRLARRDKKAFLSDQCREIEENNRMGKTRDLLKKIRDNKGTFHGPKDRPNKGQKWYGPNRSRRY